MELLESLELDELPSLSSAFDRCEWKDDIGVSKIGLMGGVGGGVSSGLSGVVGRGVGVDGMGGLMSDFVSPGIVDGAGVEVCCGSFGKSLPFIGQKLFISGSG